MTLLTLLNLWPPFETEAFTTNNVGALRIAAQDVFVPGAETQDAFALGAIQQDTNPPGSVTQDAS